MNPNLPLQPVAITDFRSKSQPVVPDRSIGSILVNVGRLSVADAEKIMRYQSECNVRFGDAAIELGLLTPADIDFALSRQFEYAYLLPGQSEISEEVVAAYEPFTNRVEALRALRNQLMARWFQTSDGGRALAITSAERGDGRSFLAANLAVVFSQQGQRTLLIDADLRNPCQHQLFNLENRVGLSSILSSRNGIESIQGVPELQNLSLLTAGAPPPNPLELLGRPLFSEMLQELSLQFDVILIDTPAGAEFSDAQTIAARAGAAIVVTHQNFSHVNKVRDLVTALSETRTQLVGTVLNNF
ncbi:chain length determinant protein tyrosine kinase EpsG [Actimicrobium antarcticum]|uniref:Chain length determinant protein tyrosine kinase EpsG n=1 Tax=Actimicrobium antarcticum TaxID=1051899 RepID=A0ABP7T4I9_9BURK